MSSKYELIDHTADIALKIYGQGLPDLFCTSGHALFDVIAGIDTIAPITKRVFSLERDNPEELLVEWLGSLLYAFDTELLLFSRFSVLELNNTRLVAEAEGETVDENRHSIETAIKAITYHNLRIRKTGEIWEATVVMDV